MAAIAVIALTTDKLLNQSMPITGTVSMSQKEQVEAISRLREREGKTPIEISVVSPEEWKKQMSQYHMPEDFQEQILEWHRIKDGVPGKTPFEQWLEINKDAFLQG